MLLFKPFVQARLIELKTTEEMPLRRVMEFRTYHDITHNAHWVPRK
jgi:hypothetical protein